MCLSVLVYIVRWMQAFAGAETPLRTHAHMKELKRILERKGLMKGRRM